MEKSREQENRGDMTKGKCKVCLFNKIRAWQRLNKRIIDEGRKMELLFKCKDKAGRGRGDKEIN
jgi:hypothetical protein